MPSADKTTLAATLTTKMKTANETKEKAGAAVGDVKKPSADATTPAASPATVVKNANETKEKAGAAVVDVKTPSVDAITPAASPAPVTKIADEAKEKSGEVICDATMFAASLAKVKKIANEAKEKAVGAVCDAKTLANQKRENAVALVRDPQFQTCTIATAGGAVTFGAAGGAFGLASGVVVGSTVGVVPALFTLGLSIPAGGVIGGLTGACGGTLLGCVCGSAGGFTIYKYRIEIQDGFVTLKMKTKSVVNATKERIETRVCKFRASVSDVALMVKQRSLLAIDSVKARSSEAVTLATNTRVGVTSSAAVAGAVLGGTTTGALGTVAGAAVGIIPAVFTLGLSIPVGAMAGLCVGTAVGGSAGAVGGGLVGYGGFTHRKSISDGVHSSWSNVSAAAKQLKTKTFICAADAKASMRSMVRASTGGSDPDNHVQA
jgi:hypothetical protein